MTPVHPTRRIGASPCNFHPARFSAEPPRRFSAAGTTMCTRFVTVLIIAGLALPAFAQKKEQDRIENSGLVVKEILNIPEGIPHNLLAKAECVVVIPSTLRLAFIVGGSYGRGVITCRSGQDFKQPWGAPSMMALEGASFGFQAGGQATDFVLLLMNPRAASSILSSKVKLGADASAAAGPVGRTSEAALDIFMRAEILSYSRSRGLFAGISLSGSTLRPDNRANRNLYGKNLDAKEIVLKGEAVAPPCAGQLLDTLNAKSPSSKAAAQPAAGSFLSPPQPNSTEFSRHTSESNFATQRSQVISQLHERSFP
jgi:SH3 domain-containing YSC84-like protein 1